jgi:tetratricopeptide (TPR) repeat protein
MLKRGHLEVLYRNVRDKLKCGRLDGFQKADVRAVDRFIAARAADGRPALPFDEGTLQYDFLNLQVYLHDLRKEGRDLAFAADPLNLKALSISLEFRDYFEELSSDSWRLLAGLARQFLDEFRAGSHKVSTSNERGLLKEKVRLVTIYANQLRRPPGPPRLEEAADAVRMAKDVVLNVLRESGAQCHTLLGGLCYVEGKLLRHHGRNKECERLLTEAVAHYTAWVKEDSRDPKDVQLASYKIATFLGDIAWSKNSRGFCTDALALLNVARLIIVPTGWQLDKASLDLIYADVERALAGTDPKRLAEAVKIVDRSYDVFKKHPHDRMKARAAYASALLNYYGDNLGAAERMLGEAERFYAKPRNVKWLVNCSTLRARIKVRQGRAGEALNDLDKSIDEANAARLMNQFVVAQTVKGEALCALGDYGKALEAFDVARTYNEKRIGAGIEVSSERNKYWILLSRAETHLRRGDLGAARRCLKEWQRLGGAELAWLHDKAKRLGGEIEDGAPQAFTIENGTDDLRWKKHVAELATWLIGQASLKVGSEKNSDLARALGISTNALGQLRKKACDDAPPAAGLSFPRRHKKR